MAARGFCCLLFFITAVVVVAAAHVEWGYAPLPVIRARVFAGSDAVYGQVPWIVSLFENK